MRRRRGDPGGRDRPFLRGRAARRSAARAASGSTSDPASPAPSADGDARTGTPGLDLVRFSQDAILQVGPSGAVEAMAIGGLWPLGRDAFQVGRSLTEVFDRRDRSRAARMLLALDEESGSRSFTGRLRGDPDTPAWVDATLRVKIEPGTGRRWLLVCLRDITERRWAEEELRRREHLLRSVTAASPVGIFAMRDEDWTFSNHRLQEITGLSAEELRQGGLQASVHPEHRELIGPPGRVPANGHYRFLRPDGEELWLSVQTATEVAGRGATTVGVVEDVTNEQTARQHAALLSAVVASTPDLVLIVSPDGTVRFTNPSARDVLGSSAERRGADGDGLHATAVFGVDGWARLCADALPRATSTGDWSGECELLDADGMRRPVSLVMIAHRDGRGALDRISLIARDMTEQKALEARLEREASHDQLTGLPLRAMFDDALERALAHADRTGSKIAVLFCDLDRFKAVNDSLGHAAGDLLLRAVGERLQSTMRGSDVAARIGGDEFLVLLHDLDTPAAARHAAERVRTAVDEPIVIDGVGTTVHPTFSIGVAVSGGQETAKVLIGRADEAMYRAKELGKNRVAIYDDRRPRARAAATLMVEQSLRAAISDGQLALRYQPIVDLRTGDITTVEALVRWEHPEQGLLAPRSFIDLAEKTGLIRELGTWVLRNAISDAARWVGDPTTPDLVLSVNLSAKQLVDPGLSRQVERLLRAAEVPAACFCVELTEREIATDEAVAQRELREIRRQGALVAVDDFGTGYSSLAQLRRLPVDVLKIDAAFVAGLGTDPADEAIVHTLQGLADALSLKTVAEGVETEQQRAALLDLGCTAAQGYLFHRPVNIETLLTMLRDSAGRPSSIDIDAVPTSGPAGTHMDVDGDRHPAQ